MIEWCNSNSGFIQAVSAVCTIILSVVASIIAIRNARFPYRKRLLLYCARDCVCKNGDERIYAILTAVNVGYGPTNIVELALYVRDRFKWEKIQNYEEQDVGFNKIDSFDKCENTYVITQSFLVNMLQCYNKNSRIYIKATDATKKVYWKRYLNVGKFVEMYGLKENP